jgi:anti-anti-sigma factor
MPSSDRSRLPQHPQLQVTTTRLGGHLEVAVTGELDLATAGEFLAAVREALARDPVRLDLREVSFLGSSGIQALDVLLRDVAREQWQLTIDPVLQRGVQRVLELTGVLALLPLDRSATDPPSV